MKYIGVRFTWKCWNIIVPRNGPGNKVMNVPMPFVAATRAFLSSTNASIRFYRAPARVNIIGEHTDYNDGFVLPVATNLHSWLGLTPRQDRIIEIHSGNVNETESFSLDELQPRSDVDWIDYVKGVAAMLERNGLRLRGANILIDSEIPLGAGLSSSASLEVIVARALLDLANLSLPAADLARLCKQAEHEFAHVRCGIMDQYTIACARRDFAILLDCRSLEATEVPISNDIAFVITDSGVRHRLPDGDYNSRGSECAAAVEKLRAFDAAVETLRDVTPDMLTKAEATLGDVLFRRCRHIINENDRVQQVVDALEQEDVVRIGAMLTACHASLRDDYEVSCEEIDTLVETANGCDGVLGSRMVGGGFGGCVLSVTTSTYAERVRMQIGERFAKVAGVMPWQHIVEPADAVQEVLSP
ncbi:MAG: galactokinase [Woeseiaceae bacterium]